MPLQADVKAYLNLPKKNWLSETLMRVMIKGKRGRVVLLLPTEEVTDAIDLILNVGEDVG